MGQDSASLRYLPLFFDMRGRAALVCGGGAVAERKVRLLRDAGARVTVVSPDLTPALAELARNGAIRHLPERFEAAQIDGQRLVVAATDEAAVNAAVAAAAESRGIWVNVVDDAEHSSCIVPAIVDRSPLVIAVSSGGTAPMLARAVRAQIELALDASLGRLAQLLAAWRGRIRQRIESPEARRAFYEDVLQGPVQDAVRREQPAEAEQALAETLQRAARPTDAERLPGRVSLVGAGPGDAGLLTLHGYRALQRADVVLHDRLVSAEVLALARRDALLIEVGKQARRPSVAQEHIHALMIEHALAGRAVVRLKGGDPFIFGRGGEELEALRARGIQYEVVPGISAAIAAAAYAGIPLTHRDHADGLRLVAAQRREGAVGIDYRHWASSRDTLACYMGLAQLAELSEQLIRHGRDAATPVALVENASRRSQRVVTGRLDQLDALAREHALESPTVVIIGAVAALADTLHWFGASASASTAAGALRAEARVERVA